MYCNPESESNTVGEASELPSDIDCTSNLLVDNLGNTVWSEILLLPTTCQTLPCYLALQLGVIILGPDTRIFRLRIA